MIAIRKVLRHVLIFRDLKFTLWQIRAFQQLCMYISRISRCSHTGLNISIGGDLAYFMLATYLIRIMF